MKKLERLFIHEMNAKVLSHQDMKVVKGGSGVYCHCYGDSGSQGAMSCSSCERLCGSAGVQNCNSY